MCRQYAAGEDVGVQTMHVAGVGVCRVCVTRLGVRGCARRKYRQGVFL